MRSNAPLFLRGRLLQDCELLSFGDNKTRDDAFNMLKANNYNPERVRQNVLLIDNPMELFFRLKKFTEIALEFIVQPMKVTRSLRQNRFYWGVLIHAIIEEHYKFTGELVDKDRVHLDNVINIWGWKPEIETVFGREVIRLDKAPSTSKMSKAIFSQFLDTIIAHYSIPTDGRPFVYELWRYIDEGDGTYNQYIKKYGKV
jgi:hypothetical protein